MSRQLQRDKELHQPYQQEVLSPSVVTLSAYVHLNQSSRNFVVWGGVVHEVNKRISNFVTNNSKQRL